MYETLADDQLMDLAATDWNALVTVEQSRDWPGQLQWQNADQQNLTDTYSDYLSRHGQLNELFALPALTEQLRADGYVVGFAEDTYDVLTDFDRWHRPLEVRGLELKTSTGKPSELYDYQRFSINRALERIQSRSRHDRFFYFGWGAGTGKSAACAAGALEAVNRGQVDLVLAFTLRKLKLNLRDFFITATPLRGVVVDGTKPKRDRIWADPDIQVFVNNYDKVWWDFDVIAERIKDKRVLFIFDEASVLLTDGTQRTRVRKAMDELMGKCHSTAWPMSATIVDYSPFTYYDNFSLGTTAVKHHPLGTRKDFEARYLNGRTATSYANPSGRGYFTIVDYDWNHTNLQEVRHRVAHCTQNARKTDPGVRDNFPGIQTVEIRVQLSDQDRELYEIVKDQARAAFARGESPVQHMEVMRYICNHPGALGVTRNAIGQQLAAARPKLCTGKNSSKLEVFCNQVESIASGGDQVIGFTHWTELSLHLVSAELRRRRIGFVDHHGAMSDQAAYDAQQRHRSDPSCTLFWSSDAGSYGLNFQHCRYVISYEAPYSYALLQQRMSRIDRADGELTGRTNYVLITDDTIEEKIWQKNKERMALASATTGTMETTSYGEEEVVPHDMEWLLN